MKTKIFNIILAFSTFCNAQIINFPDVNFKAKLLSANETVTIASIQDATISNYNNDWVPSGSPMYSIIDLNGNGEIEISEAQLIKGLRISGGNILDLTGIEYFTNLKYLTFIGNNVQNFNFNITNNLEYLDVSQNQLTNLNLLNFNNLKYLNTSLNYQLTTLNTGNLSNLISLNCYNNSIVNLDLSSNIQLQGINCGGNELTTLDLSNIHYLQGLFCSNNHITSLDLGVNPFIKGLFCDYNQLSFLNLKCGNTSWDYLQFNYNSNLQFVCFDDEDFNLVTARLLNYGYTNCNANTYCSFIPGGNFNTITGTVSIDIDINGCDINDFHQANIRIDCIDSFGISATFTNSNGTYNFYKPSDIYTITPQIENINFYTLNPTNANIILNGNNESVTQNFCITPNGNHNDLEVVLLPINQVRPGFDAHYKLIYKNKGTTTQSGTINFSFDDSVLDFISSNPNVSSQSTGSLNWNFTNILPFESREIDIILNLNSPTETPALNSGDLLNYTAFANGQPDETPNDNIANLNQIVVNSYDPNDKTCLEGTTITPSMVGEYVHYLIRFENNGTANAQNIVVKDMIDTDKFDINTLIQIKGSHNFETRISSTNKVEFIFQNINLPFDDANNDGYVSFKIKTKPNLVVGNTFSNLANIYFDYNFPIVTNNYTTTIQNTLGLQENDFINNISVNPNPVKNILNFKTKHNISKIEVYDIAGRILSSNSISENKIDISELKAGNYILKLYTEKGIMNTKIIKE